MDTSSLVEAKAQEITSELEAWAKESGILKPGQQIRFSLWIGELPLVERESVSPVALTLKIEEFFTIERLMRDGKASRGVCNRVIRALAYGLYVYVGNGIARREVEIHTIKDFVEYVTISHLRIGIPNFGDKCTSVVLNTLEAAGISLREN